MKKYKIIGIKYTLWGNLLRFNGFVLEDIDGEVNPFMSGEFHVPELNLLIKDEYPFNNSYFSAEIEWAKTMIGKYLHCDQLLYKAYATIGQIEFTNE
ncbi:MAG: hypothetical protein WC679_01150 [Bacteroidales bacterium]|jgi:hypothetical protein